MMAVPALNGRGALARPPRINSVAAAPPPRFRRIARGSHPAIFST